MINFPWSICARGLDLTATQSKVALYNYDNLPISKNNLPKYVQNCAKY